MRVLICGGRDFDNAFFMGQVLEKLNITHVIHGGAKGADYQAGEWAYTNNIPCSRYPALWYLHKKAAGPIRNQQMLDEGKPDLVVAFPGGSGTADMVRRAKKAGVEVIEVTYE